MLILYLEALVAIVLSLSILMALAWVVQQRTGNSGWVDTIWTFSLGLVGAGSRCGRLAESRRSSSTCCARVASAIVTISRAPACSFHCRRRKREWSHELRI
jgi:steroid 5-alpha reductase family enzyme